MIYQVLVVTNSLFYPYLRRMLGSLFRLHRDVSFQIWLAYEDLSGDELFDLEAFCGQHGNSLHKLYVGDEFKKKVASRSGINVETYYRILALSMLPEEMERVLYLDADMIIKGRIDELYHADIEGKAFAVCEDIFGILNGFHEANKRRMGIPAGYSYFNAGVMLFHLRLLRAENAPEKMIGRIYKDYERYEYNDQDVMNEMYYDRIRWMGWDMYNCPPAWYYLDRAALAEGRVEFASYDRIREAATDPKMIDQYQNVTAQIYENARIIHYLGDTKPWSTTRKEAAVYDIFDRAYWDADVEEKSDAV